MTPAEFHSAYRGTADQVYAGTGIDPIALLAQWANETAWGQAVFGNNLGNIRCSPTSFCRYATLGDFGQAAIAVWHQTAFINNRYPNGFEPFRAQAAAAASTDGALAAIVASPWSGQNYGGSLDAFYHPLEGFELTPEEDAILRSTAQNVTDLHNALLYGLGTPNPSNPYSDIYEAKIRLIVQQELAKLPAVTEPPEPAEPKSVTLNIPAQTVTGTLG